MNNLLLKDLLAAAGLTPREAALRLEISERIMVRYASGQLVVPRVVYFAVLYVISEQRAEAKSNSGQSAVGELPKV